ncbi:MAG: GNAT family N-acetyltransferase [Oscillatoria sp. PMC 1068.18]|nr:GNAT family N-acetyltransferase [Oscillatoria sp. PMC 1076.18]MEC4988674.1 GNAT family N-acetyltransferase [Oscillatoria sp. PMC 1068.18]
MNRQKVLLRDAQLQDITSIMELLDLKAKFDGCPESLVATSAKLAADLFGEKPLAFVLLAEINHQAVGFATYHFNYSTFLAKPGIWLDDLYVKAEYRSQKIGQGLILKLCEIAEKNGCERIDWTVSLFNEAGIKFYQRLGAKVKPNTRLCRLDNEAISNISLS